MKKTSRRKFGSQLAGAMAALPIAALVTSAQDKPQDKDQEKEKEKEKKKDRPLADDPPILVGGGGGSRVEATAVIDGSYIWILKTLAPGTAQEPGKLLPIPSPQPDYPVPNMALYHCYELPVKLGKYKTNDGSNEGGSHDIKDRKKHRTRFYRE